MLMVLLPQLILALALLLTLLILLLSLPLILMPLLILLLTLLLDPSLILLVLSILMIARLLLPLLEILLCHGVARLVAIFFGPDTMLLLDCMRIAIAVIIALVGWQWCRRWRGATVPMIPSAATLLPIATPMLTPMRRRVGTPATEIRRRLAIIAHRHA